MSAVGQGPLARLFEGDPQARDLLHLLACFSPWPLPEQVLSEAKAALPGDLADPSRRRELLDELGPELVQVEDGALAVSEEVARVSEESLDEGERRRWCALALAVLRNGFPEESEDVDNWDRCESLLSPALAALTCAEALGLGGEDVVWLLERAGAFLHSKGDGLAAKNLCERALAASTLDAGHPLIGSVHQILGCALESLGQLDDARAEEETALAIHQESLDPGDLDLIADEVNLATVLLELKDLEGATEHARRAVEAVQARGSLERIDPLAHRALAWAQCEAGELEEARAGFRRALGYAEELFGDNHPEVAAAHIGLGFIADEAEEPQLAKEELEAALEICESRLPAGHPQLAAARSNLGPILQTLGALGPARAQLELALDAAKALPGDHRSLWIRHRKLASVMQSLGRLQAAREHCEEALRLSERAKGPRDPRVADDLIALADILEDLGRRTAARDACERAVMIAEAAPDAKEDLAAHVMRLANAALGLGDLGEAQGRFAQALRLNRELHGPDDHRSVEARLALAGVLNRLKAETAATQEALGRTEAAEQIREEAISELSGALSDELESTDVEALVALSSAAAASDPELARSALQKAEALLATAGDLAPASLRRTVFSGWRGLGRILLGSADFDRAGQAFEAALPLAAERLGSEAVVLHELGDARRGAGKLEEAIDLYRRSIERDREIGEEANPRSIAASLLGIGRARRALGDLQGAEEAFQERMRTLALLPEPDLRGEGVTLHDIAELRGAEGKLEEAAALFHEAAGRKREAGEGGDPRDLAITLLALGRAEVATEGFEAALSAFEERLEVLTSMPERDYQAEGVTLHDLGDVRRIQGHPEQAVELFRQAALRKREAEDGTPGGLATTLRSLGLVLFGLKRYDEALAVQRERLDALSGLSERDPGLDGLALYDIAAIDRAQGHGEEAIEHLTEAAERTRESKQEAAPKGLAIILRLLGWMHESRRELEPALAVYEERLEVLKGLTKPDSWDEGIAEHDLGDVHFAAGRVAEAVGHYRRAIELKREGAGADGYSGISSSLRALGSAEFALRNLDAALAAHEERLSILTSLPDPEPQLEGVALHDIAEVREAQGDLGAAVEVFRAAAERKREAEDPAKLDDLAITLFALGGVLETRGEFEQALAVYRERLEILTGLPERDPGGESLTLQSIADVRRAQGKSEEALVLYAEAVERARQNEGPAAADDLAAALVAWSSIPYEEGDIDRVRSAIEEAIGLLRAEPEAEPHRLAEAILVGSQVSRRCGDLEAALSQLREVNELFAAIDSPDPVELAAVKSFFADACKELNRDDEAEVVRAEARGLLESAIASGEALDLAHRLPLLTSLCIDSNALGLAEQVVDRARGLDGFSSKELAGMLHFLARAYEVSRSDPGAALPIYEERLELLRALDERDPQLEGVTLHDIGDVLRADGRLEEAIASYRAAVERKREARPEPSPRDLSLTLRKEAEASLENEDLEAALPVLEESNRLIREAPDAKPEAIEKVRGLLAETYTELGREADAKRTREEAIPTTEP